MLKISKEKTELREEFYWGHGKSDRKSKTYISNDTFKNQNAFGFS